MAGQQFFGSPVDDDMQINPSENRDHDLRHVNSPKSIRFDRAGLQSGCLAGRLQCLVFENQQLMRFHQTVNPFSVDGQMLMEFQIRPDPAISPIGMFRLQVFYPREQFPIRSDDLPMPLYQSFFFSSMVSSPMVSFSLRFSRSSRSRM